MIIGGFVFQNLQGKLCSEGFGYSLGPGPNWLGHGDSMNYNENRIGNLDLRMT